MKFAPRDRLPFSSTALALFAAAQFGPWECALAFPIAITYVNPGDVSATPGHPAKLWTDDEKKIVNEAKAEWDAFHVKGKNTFPTAYTLRWEDSDLFMDWGGANCNLTDAYAFTVINSWPTDCTANQNFKVSNFPANEIYFNTTNDLLDTWYFDKTPGTDEADEIGNKYDFLSAVKHELGHILGITCLSTSPPGCVDHLPDNPTGHNGAMETHLNGGERDRVTAQDIALAKSLGVTVPEPGTAWLVFLGSIVLAAFRSCRAAEP